MMMTEMMMMAMMTHFDDFLVLPAVTSSPIMIPICNIHPSWQFLCTRWYKYSSLNWTKFSFHSIPHKRFQSSKVYRSREGLGGKSWRKAALKEAALKCNCKCGKNSKCRSNLLLSRLFNGRASVSNWSQFAHKTRYRCIAEAWEENFS